MHRFVRARTPVRLGRYSGVTLVLILVLHYPLETSVHHAWLDSPYTCIVDIFYSNCILAVGILTSLFGKEHTGSYDFATIWGYSSNNFSHCLLRINVHHAWLRFAIHLYLIDIPSLS